MAFLMGVLTVILAVDCLFLMLLILIQLPKKEAGMGTAFGGAATDALFGAGTGNALTNLTRYAATIFFILSLILSLSNSSRSAAERNRLNKVIKSTMAEQTGSMAAPPRGGSNSPAAASGLLSGTTTNVNTTSTITTNAEATPKVTPKAPATATNAPKPTTSATPPVLSSKPATNAPGTPK